METALKHLNSVEMKARKLQAQAKAAGASTKLQEVHETELTRSVSEIAVLQDLIKDISVGSAGRPLQDEKVDLPENSGKLLSETKDITSIL